MEIDTDARTRTQDHGSTFQKSQAAPVSPATPIGRANVYGMNCGDAMYGHRCTRPPQESVSHLQSRLVGGDAYYDRKRTK